MIDLYILDVADYIEQFRLNKASSQYLAIWTQDVVQGLGGRQTDSVYFLRRFISYKVIAIVLNEIFCFTIDPNCNIWHTFGSLRVAAKNINAIDIFGARL